MFDVSYVVSVGIPNQSPDDTKALCEFALRAQDMFRLWTNPTAGAWPWLSDPKSRRRVNVPSPDYKIGLHVGPVTSGIIGKTGLLLKVFGDTMNLSSRMQTTAEPNRIQMSSVCTY